jgi:hypothetical protein
MQRCKFPPFDVAEEHPFCSDRVFVALFRAAVDPSAIENTGLLATNSHLGGQAIFPPSGSRSSAECQNSRVRALSGVVSQQASEEPRFNGVFIANAATRGLTSWSKSETLMRITSQCVPALNAINSAAAILSSSNTGNPKRLPKGGIAPNSHSGKSSANSVSAARRSWLNCRRRRTSPKSTIWSAGRTSSPGPLSATYTTVFAKVSGRVRSANAVSRAV